jgi:hypothetical protein
MHVNLNSSTRPHANAHTKQQQKLGPDTLLLYGRFSLTYLGTSMIITGKLYGSSSVPSFKIPKHCEQQRSCLQKDFILACLCECKKSGISV